MFRLPIPRLLGNFLRKWRGRFNEVIDTEILPKVGEPGGTADPEAPDYFADFHEHPAHEALAVLSEYQPRDSDGNIISLVV